MVISCHSKQKFGKIFLFQKDVGDLFQLGPGPKKIKPLSRNMVLKQEIVRITIGHNHRVKVDQCRQALFQEVPASGNILVGDHLVKIRPEPLEQQPIGIAAPLDIIK